MEASAIAGRRLRNGQIPARVAAFADRLYSQGYSIERIGETLNRYGYSVRPEQIRTWVDEEYAHAMRIARQRRARKRGNTRPAVQLKHERIMELHNGGVHAGSIAKVMKVDFGLDISRHQVLSIIKGKVKNIGRILADEGDRLREAESQSQEE